MTTVVLAMGGHQHDGVTFADWDWDQYPLGILVALPYLPAYRRIDTASWRPTMRILDSGAFSAWKSGKVVDIDALVEASKDPYWDETVGLDVIGSAEGSRKNLDYMRAKGSPAMPVFHIGDDWGLLEHYCRNWDKVGLSCRFGEPVKESLRFYEQCFARQWPHKFHSFGWTAAAMLRRFPFHSADSATWALAPRSFNNLCIGPDLKQVHFRGVRIDGPIFAGQQAKAYARLHVELRERWAKELARL